MKKKPKKKFKRRYVFGEGYPWALGTGALVDGISLVRAQHGVDLIKFEFPPELWSSETPKYRLVLERVPVEKAVVQ